MEVKIELLMTALIVTRTMLSRRSLYSNLVARWPCVVVAILIAFPHFARRVLALARSHASFASRVASPAASDDASAGLASGSVSAVTSAPPAGASASAGGAVCRGLGLRFGLGRFGLGLHGTHVKGRLFVLGLW